MAFAAAVGVAEQAVGTARGVRAQPVRDVHGQRDPPARSARQGQTGQGVRNRSIWTWPWLVEPLAEHRKLPGYTAMSAVVRTDQLKPLVVIVLLSQEE